MYKDQPLTLKQVLPSSLTVDDFYVVVAGVLAFLAVMAIGRKLTVRDNQAGKVKAILERRKELKDEHAGPRRRAKKKPEGAVNTIRSLVMRFNLLGRQQVSHMQDLLVQAGWRSKDALYIFGFFNIVSPIVLGATGVALMMMTAQETGQITKMGVLYLAIFAYGGYKLPRYVVGRQKKKRHLAIQRALADTLDLMTICAEAGLSLAQALDRVARELTLPYPEMAQELQLTAIELGFLPDRNKALSNLAERAKLPEIKGIVSVLIQTEKYGTPIAQALRVLSAEFRQARMLRAEQKAARLPAIMTVPMICFIFPTLFIVIISPAVVRMMDQWK